MFEGPRVTWFSTFSSAVLVSWLTFGHKIHCVAASLWRCFEHGRRSVCEHHIWSLLLPLHCLSTPPKSAVHSELAYSQALPYAHWPTPYLLINISLNYCLLKSNTGAPILVLCIKVTWLFYSRFSAFPHQFKKDCARDCAESTGLSGRTGTCTILSLPIYQHSPSCLYFLSAVFNGSQCTGLVCVRFIPTYVIFLMPLWIALFSNFNSNY